MITRLLELRLTAFRAFRGEQTIPLDADVVLIHGSNGTAKTSLLAGLELALTGRVCDLQVYSDDYPRCLKHLGAVEASNATIRFRDEGGKEREITHTVGTTSCTPLSSFTLTPEERCFYLDRCYLSQSSLSRLLENYQACGKEQPEQPLVRFVRELLGLDLLENLTAGLHEAGLITRIEKSVPPLRAARETESVAEQQITDLNARLPTLTVAWQSALTELQRIAGEVGDAAPNASWDLAGIETRLQALDESANDRATAERLQKLRRSEGRLQSSLGLLGGSEDTAARARLQQQLDGAESARATIQLRLENLLARAQAALRDLDLRPPEASDLAVTFQTAAAMLGEVRGRLDTSARRLAEISAERSKLRERATEIATALTSQAPSAQEEIASRQRLAGLLAAISPHLHGEECPVCRRDFSELHAGALADRIAAEISSLGADAQALEERERQRATLELERADIARRVAAIEQQLAQEPPLPERHTVQRQTLASLADECASVEPDRHSFLRLLTTISGLRSELMTLETRNKQRTTAAGDLTQLANDLELVIPASSTAGHISGLITSHLATATDKAEKQLAGATRLRNALSAARSARQALDQIGTDLAAARQRHEQASTLIQKMRGLIQEGKDLAKAATSAKKKLLDQVFNDTLNRLWRDFFRRLAKHERFQPRLGEPVTERGQIRTTIEGHAATGDPFSQFSAVASSGNVSTAALSLFLALHLIEQPRHRVLVLDDPVQNMDDVHVVQLAGLLRKIGSSAQRQLVIAVHERALFDYLCLELSPTESHGKLLTLELQRNRPDEAPTLISTEHIWKDDRLKFGMTS